MKYLIVADLHGNIGGYERVKEISDKIEPEKIIFLGDMCDGSGAVGVNNVLKKIYVPMIAVRGNCDREYVFSELDLGDKGNSYVENKLNRTLFFTHGHLYVGKMPPCLTNNDIMFFGHYHSPEISKYHGIIKVCVGSLGEPRGYLPATYCVLTDNDISIYNANDDSFIVGINLEEC